MKVFEVAQIRKADEVTISSEGISSFDLMERAAGKCVEKIKEIISKDEVPVIFCGNGNNGGDGLAIARLLLKEGIRARVFVLEFSQKSSKDFIANLEKLQSFPEVDVKVIKGKDDFPVFEKGTIIDALLGTGNTRPAEGILKELIIHLNGLGSKIISIDMPSGIPADGIFNAEDWKESVFIRASLTLSFQFPKLAFFMPETGPWVGEWFVLDIGLNPVFIEETQSPYALINSKELIGSISMRARFSHKGSYGHLLLLAGSRGKSGAALLASKAALRTGAGKLTLGSDRQTLLSLGGYCPEAMSFEGGDDELNTLPKLQGFSAIAIGPGLGKGEGSAKALKQLLQDWQGPLVLDADALNLLADNPTWVNWIPRGSVLTPHPLELKRLLRKENLSFWEMLGAGSDLAQKQGIFINLKSAYSCLITPSGRFLFNGSGTPALAKAGSGDVLTGIIGAFLAMGFSVTESVCIGNYVHGRAASLSLGEKSQHSLLAGEIEQFIGQAIAEIEI